MGLSVQHPTKLGMKRSSKGIDSTAELQEVTPFHQRTQQCSRHVKSGSDNSVEPNQQHRTLLYVQKEHCMLNSVDLVPKHVLNFG